MSQFGPFCLCRGCVRKNECFVGNHKMPKGLDKSIRVSLQKIYIIICGIYLIAFNVLDLLPACF